jgi:hypothetical protein
MQGSWEGTLNVKPTRAQLRLVLKIFSTNGAYRATLDSIDQAAKDIPVTRLSAGPTSLHAELPALDADYRATLNADGTQMSGTFRQVKQSFPLTLKRTTEADQVADAMAGDQLARQPGSDLQGAWEGVLTVANTELHLNLRIAEPAPGTFQAQLDSLDQGARNLPINLLTYSKPDVHFEMTAINAAYQGNLNDRDDQMTGTWTQMGKKMPLTFRRAQTNDQAVAEAQMDFGQGNPNQVQGHWKGALSVSKTELHIVFHIASMPDGSYSATMDSPDQGASGIPATAVEFTYPNLRMEWSGFDGVFTAKLDNGRLSGTWRQGKVSLPLKLEREKAG